MIRVKRRDQLPRKGKRGRRPGRRGMGGDRREVVRFPELLWKWVREPD